MLRYLGSGERRYAERPVAVYRRDRWEFQAVIDGRCAPVRRQGPELLRGRSLWLFPPEDLHGWTGEPGRPCTVCVFHFETAPDPLGASAREQGGLRVDLTEEDCRQLVELGGALALEMERPDALSPLRAQKALLELSLLVAGHVDQSSLARHTDRRGQVVHNALAWYEEHMGEAPGVERIAGAANTSVSHLRRLFHEVLGRSPRDVLKARQIERARFLLRNTKMSLAEIALAAGFTNLSSFSRSYKQEVGLAPQYWRQSIAVQRNPGARLAGKGRLRSDAPLTPR